MATLIDLDTRQTDPMKTHLDLSPHMLKHQPLLNQVIIAKGNSIIDIKADD